MTSGLVEHRTPLEGDQRECWRCGDKYAVNMHNPVALCEECYTEECNRHDYNGSGDPDHFML